MDISSDIMVGIIIVTFFFGFVSMVVASMVENDSSQSDQVEPTESNNSNETNLYDFKYGHTFRILSEKAHANIPLFSHESSKDPFVIAIEQLDSSLFKLKKPHVTREQAKQIMAWLTAFTESEEFDALNDSPSAKKAVIDAINDLNEEAKWQLQDIKDENKVKLQHWANQYHNIK